MKKIIFALISVFFFIFFSFIIALSTIGIETNRFNNLIKSRINQSNNNVNLELTSVKFKLDIKEISLFIETSNPKINYRNAFIPAKNIKVYIDFLSLATSEPKIKKINLSLNELNINQLKKLSITLKPSNFTSFLNNKIRQGKLIAELEFYLDKKNLIKNFIARGSVSNLKTEITKNINLNKAHFSFFADKSDVLIKNIFGEIGPISIKDGDVQLKLLPEISLVSNFRSNIKINNKSENYTSLVKNFKYAKDMNSLNADLNNTFLINFDKTYKVKKYNYKNNGRVINVNFDFKKPIENYLLSEKINQLSLVNSEIKTHISSEKNNVSIKGKYSLNKGNILSYDLSNIINNELLKLKLDVEYDKPVELEFINYKKSKESIGNLLLDLTKKKENIKVNKLSFIESNNSVLIEDIEFNKNKFLSLKNISVKTFNNGIKNNDFSISFDKKIIVNGTQFDASNLPKIINQKNSKNIFSQINKDIEIDFLNIAAPLSENLKNFKLIGEIRKGKFIKISSKGDFGSNNFLDITMKNDQKNKKKYLEVYSDLTRPLLTEYNFFKGLTGGKLLYSSIIDGDKSNSKLKIENFNVVNAPGMIKLLSLADLSGLADLAEGEGMSFDVLEIQMEKDKDSLKINEILALGPSMSVLMEGYQNPSITSLRGTLVPAKTLNKMISKIPVLGNIIIPKEIGEGLFGISFKIKGPPGKIKTTINPIRTITPRFIQKILDRNKKTK
jgi:hypothetical protein